MSSKFVLQQEDGTVENGNARGAYSVDLQMSRDSADQVTNGINSVIVGGLRNKTTSKNSIVVGGESNTTGNRNTVTIVGGEGNSNSGGLSFIGAGLSNTITDMASGYAVITGGASNVNSSQYGTISGGRSNTVLSGSYSSILGGQSNATSTGTHATVLGGYGNTASGSSSIAGGYSNTASNQSTVALGESNVASGLGAVAIGRSNTASGTGAIAIGTSNNVTYQLGFSGGNGNTVSVKGTAFGGSNTVAGGEWSAAIGTSNSITSTGNSYVIGDRIGSTATYAFGTGNNSKAYLTGQRVHASGWFILANGDQQISDLIASKLDTLSSAATTTLTLWDSSLIIPYGTNRAWNVQVKTVAVVTAIIGTATGVSVGDTLMQDDKLLFSKVSGVSSVVGTTSQDFISSTSLGTASMSYSAGASQELALTFTAPTFAGGGSVTMRVVSKVELVEVAF